MKRLLLLPMLAVLILGTTAGSRTIQNLCDHGVRVDGVKLKHKRVVELEARLDRRLVIESAVGDIELHGVDGDDARLEVEIWERYPDDVEVAIEDGEIVLRSRDHEPCVIGRVFGTIPAGIDLEIETGCGDVDLIDMARGHEIDVETGLGDITLQDIGGYRSIDASTGKGDIRLGPAEGLEDVELETGMGGIKIREAEVEELAVSSGFGSIHFLDCTFGSVSGSTGFGDVSFKRTRYDDSDISTGFGRVHRGR
jgi:hypothetical protein